MAGLANYYKLLKVKLIDISPNSKVYSFRVRVRVFLSEFFLSWTLSWTSASFLEGVLFFVDVFLV